ncbi:type II secretion system protein [Thalassomonas sp. M1454]|uniref:type II secretion system protein n=1 Tax=Thalassomonas sp. M1454 TaxID=2594477 RepID=UPI00117DB1BB|nr:prepilin-type N-terminal cleavage/methylation domain-containing protein [Thalassomonas sp. M1454]TRX52804.1 prepilin-type N-terminal cleavage/methylation domain-containing protein [Thalassomonas sp. M1454]
MNNNKGFTLIELVIVIVILGILAATAAPKFIDLTGDARGAVIEGVEGSVNSAADIAHAKALIEGATAAYTDGSTNDFIMVAGTKIELNYGWPTNESIELMVEISDEEIVFASGAQGTGSTWTHNGATDTANCFVNYDNNVANAETRPSVESKIGTDLIPGC